MSFGKEPCERAVQEKSFLFAIRIVRLYQYLCNDKKEYVMSKQLLRSGTSIGANVSEAERAQSPADFYSKMSISLKEASETYYWLRLLNATDYLSNNAFYSMEADIKELIALLTTICKTAQQNSEK
jgi:four helix bundle protein